ncbi:hypothetical protein H9X98_09360 [Aeromonas jandaei]|uniref:hypothetical protein n=1 Tax=Aeromonas jandaei TaxID=650 RepID=UPI001F176C3B|nr:hypothetical protein [Aeromonas jandaei]MCF7717908.1 hypothetical protein [Aeromonas jandaei]
MYNDDFKRKFHVKVLNPSVNYWVVRAGEDAAFLPHFYENELVAIGHLDSMEFLDSELRSSASFLAVHARYKAYLKEKRNSKASIGNKSGQVYRFVQEMKVGDIIVSLDEKHILTGIITSEAYKDSSQKNLRDKTGAIIGNALTYSLRRDVSWGNRVSRSSAPAAVRSSLRANQAVFKVTEHWQTLNHWLSVIFTKDETIYFSSRIMQKDKISNFDVSQFSHILNLFEAVSAKISESGYTDVHDIEKFVNDVYRECSRNRDFHLKTQQSFMSPGDYWGSLSGDKVKNVIFVMAFCALFNSEAVFADGMEKDIADHHRDDVNEIVNHIKESYGFDYIKEGLKVNLPKPHKLSVSEDTGNAEDNMLDFPTDEASDTGEI